MSTTFGRAAPNPSAGGRRRRGWLLRAALVMVAASLPPALAAGFPATSESLTAYDRPSQVPASACNLGASADTYVDEALLSSPNGSATQLHVQSSLLANRRTFVRFDVASCALPAGARVKSAKLELYMSQAPSQSRTYEVTRVGSTWDPATLTWSSQPSASPTATAIGATGVAGNVVLSFPVKADVEAFVAGTAVNHGWRVKDAVEGSVLPADLGVFSSSEHGSAAQRPVLAISYYP